jgi:AraC family transcriptional regulator, alkane utilization regulator
LGLGQGAIVFVLAFAVNDSASGFLARNAATAKSIMDALSEVLRVVQLAGAVFLDASFTAPWCINSQQNKTLCAIYLPQSDRVVSFHLITTGDCWAMLPGLPDSAIRLSAGDILVVPQGESHIIASACNLQPIPAEILLAERLQAAAGGVMTLSHGGGGEHTQIICGFLAVQGVMKNPLLAALPRLFKVDMRGSPAAWLESSMRFAMQEAHAARLGTATVLSKLSELLFVEAIRRHVDLIPADCKGWLGGLRDRFVARALALMHEQPSYSWTVEELANRIGISRSVLAQRFTDLLAMPPMQYLAQWRMQLAAQQLRSGNQPLAAIAQQVGYKSEAAFSHAFKREFGSPPATWRRNGG